ncbi:hypothetical protein ACIBTP_33785 [Streptomyces avidinii]|uniref:hypothetical protein n=1 Tax=Streptomyces avidinii TaxID=1895 RepID=UPI0037A8A8B7
MSDGTVTLGIGAAAQAAASLVNTQQQIRAGERARAEQHEYERKQATARFDRELQLETGASP